MSHLRRWEHVNSALLYGDIWGRTLRTLAERWAIKRSKKYEDRRLGTSRKMESRRRWAKLKNDPAWVAASKTRRREATKRYRAKKKNDPKWLAKNREYLKRYRMKKKAAS
jgi:hypothetical protein